MKIVVLAAAIFAGGEGSHGVSGVNGGTHPFAQAATSDVRSVRATADGSGAHGLFVSTSDGNGAHGIAIPVAGGPGVRVKG